MSLNTTGAGLAALEARLAQDLAWLELPAKRWLADRTHDGQPMLDVAVVGAGMAGGAAAAALRLAGLTVQVFDDSPAGQEGPWLTFARMNTLRSPKSLVGPAMSLPALTFRAWFEAQFGDAAWAALDKIPRVQWAEYLRWFNKVMALDIVSEARLTGLEPAGEGVALDLTTPRGSVRRYARRVVLATGRDGLGGPAAPDFCKGLPRSLWAHSADPIDFEALRGRRVGLVGAGASAMDNAACALEAGCASVDLFIRRPSLPTVNKGKGVSGVGTFEGYASLPDAAKWRMQHYLNRTQVPPPRDSTLRVSAFDNARFHFGSPIQTIEDLGASMRVRTPKGAYELDFLIVATGFCVDLARRPELAAIAPHIRFWRDRFATPPGLEDRELSDSPDLAGDFGFQPRDEADPAAAWISRIHAFNYPATLSLGKLSGDIPGVGAGAERLARGIVSRLYCADPQELMDRLDAYDEPELLGDEWTDADA